MSVIFGKSTRFKELSLSVLTTLYEKAGDTDEHVLSNVGLTSKTYDRRNHLLTGSFDVSYPGSDCPNDIYDSMGCIELSNSDYRHVDRFKIVALEDNTSCHCILPIGANRQVQHELIPLVNGETFVAARGRLYIPDVGFTLAGRAVPAGVVIDCSTTDKSIVPDEDGIITAYYSVIKI